MSDNHRPDSYYQQQQEEGTLIPFSIELYEADPKSVRYRNGKKPDEVHYFKTVISSKTPIVSAYKGNMFFHAIHGNQYGSPHILDLMILSKLVYKFRNEYPNHAGVWRDSMDECDAVKGPERIAILKATFDNGKLTKLELVEY